MAFVVVYDTNVLIPERLRDLLMRIAASGIVQARWSTEILDEWARSLSRMRPDIEPARIDRLRYYMIDVVPDCLVTGYHGLTADFDLIDDGDRHVVAAAVRAQAQVIVTYNLKHFPDHLLAKYDIEAKHPDEFVLDTIDLNPARVATLIGDMSRDLVKPPMTIDEVLDSLRDRGLVRSVARLRDVLIRS